MHLSKLKSLYNKGYKYNYTIFWKCRKSHELTSGCLSPWYPSNFTDEFTKYTSLEQYVQANKAKLFDGYDGCDKILKEHSPKKIRQSGKKIKNMDSNLWNRNSHYIVERGNYLKFSQNEDLKKYLLSTKKNIIVKASPHGGKWGVGLHSDDERIKNPNEWKGSNILGFILMDVREIIRQNPYKNFINADN